MTVSSLDFVILLVSDPESSALFYANLFACEPVEQSPTFALFVLSNGMRLGLWSRYTAEPKVLALPGAAEIMFCSENVDDIYASWVERGIIIAQTPTQMDFGYTFVALDPDGHRIRVSKMSQEQG